MWPGLGKKRGRIDKSRWCSECKRYVLPVNSKPNVVVNSLLSIFTLGVWLVVWVCTADLSGKKPPSCPLCGTIVDDVPEGAKGD